MNILMICKGSHDCGNFTTISRISEHIQNNNNCLKTNIFQITNSIDNTLNFERKFQEFKPKVIIGLNLIRCSFITNVQMDCKIIMILGGTDINNEMNEEDKSQCITLIQKCNRIVAFSEEMKIKFQNTFSEILNQINLKINVIPQGIELANIESYRYNSENDSLLNSLKIVNFFLVVGRLRLVKDPGFIVKPFSDWISDSRNKNYHLIYVGNIEERSEEIDSFLQFIKTQSNIHHIESLVQNRVFNLMMNSRAVINCSKNEGQSTALLEAMSCGTPVLARNVAGNKDLIKHNYNGLLFENDQDFVLNLTKILNNEFAKLLIKGARDLIEENHNPDVEANTYLKIINEII